MQQLRDNPRVRDALRKMVLTVGGAEFFRELVGGLKELRQSQWEANDYTQGETAAEGRGGTRQLTDIIRDLEKAADSR